MSRSAVKPTLLTALLGKAVDATLLQPPRFKRAVDAGMNVLANLEEMNIPFQHTGLVTTQRFVAKNPDITRRVVKSFVDGIHLMRTNPEIAKKAINRHMRLNDERELEETYQLLQARRVAQTLPFARRHQNNSQRSGRSDPGGENRRSERFRRYQVSR